MPYLPRVPTWSTCPCVKVPKCQTRGNFLFFMCQRANKCAKLPKVCQLFNLVCQHAKSEPIFQLFFKRIFQFLNFSIMLNICKFKEYLGNSKKLISQNKEFKFWHLQNFIKEKPCQPNTFASFSMEHVGLTEQLFG